MKSPAFQIYPTEFVSDINVIVMTGAEVGAYALLMFVCWIENGLPDDLDELAAVGKMEVEAFKSSWERRIKRCFVMREDGLWDHPRHQAERVKQQDFSRKMADAANRRHHPGKPSPLPRQQVGTAKAMRRECSLSLSSITTVPEQIPEIPTTPPPKSPRSSKSRAGLVTTEQEVAFFGYYRSKHPRRGPPDDEQIRKVRKAYLSFSDEQMRQAVDGNLEDPWAVKTGKHEIGWIFRDHDHISQAIEHYHRANAPLVDDQGRLTADGQRVFGGAA